MAGEDHLLLRFAKIIEVHGAVRVGVLVGADCPSKKVHQSLSFREWVSEIGQAASVFFWCVAWIKRPPHQIGTNVSGGVWSGVPNSNLHRLKGGKNSIIEIISRESGPDLIANRWVDEVLWKTQSSRNFCQVFPFGYGASVLSKYAPTVASIHSGRGFDETVSLQPIPCTT